MEKNRQAIEEIEKYGLKGFFERHPNAKIVLNEPTPKRGRCPHGIEITTPPPAAETFDWEAENESQADAFYAGREDIESGICLCCGQAYTKNISESNLSRSGYCTTCGWNP